MHIWTLELGDEEKLPLSLIKRCRNLLSEEELSRADRFMFDKDAHRYVLAHALNRLMLSQFADREPQAWVFDKEAKGRPVLDQSAHSETLDFNLSHTLGMVGCALSKRYRIGFDLEPKNRGTNLEALAERQFSSIEQQQFLAAPLVERQRLFFQFWTLKESYIKLTGKGLTENLASFGFDLNNAKPLCYVQGQKVEQIRFGLFDAGAAHQAAWACQVDTLAEQITPEITRFNLAAFHALF